jgi:hypothetical protein
MSYGERTAIEGMLAMVKPRLAIEIGRAEGGSLSRIAEHSDEVVSFDIVDAAPATLRDLPNVKMLTGDSHVLLPQELERMAGQGQNVDFVLVDGDHSAAGVRSDIQDLLNSDAIRSTVILAHDTLNEEVRQGLEEVDYEACEKVGWVDLDFIPGYVARLPARLGECWGGLGLIVVDGSRAFQSGGPRRSEDLFPQPGLVWPTAQWIRSERASSPDQLSRATLISRGEPSKTDEKMADLTEELERHRAWLRGLEGSVSWRITSPLRALKRRLRERSR